MLYFSHSNTTSIDKCQIRLCKLSRQFYSSTCWICCNQVEINIMQKFNPQDLIFIQSRVAVDFFTVDEVAPHRLHLTRCISRPYFFSPVLAVRLYLLHLIISPLARHLGQYSGIGISRPGHIFAAAYSLIVCRNWITINAVWVGHLPLRQSAQLFAKTEFLISC